MLEWRSKSPPPPPQKKKRRQDFARESFYADTMPEDERRVEQLFGSAAAAGIAVRRATLAGPELRALVASGQLLVIALLDKSKLAAAELPHTLPPPTPPQAQLAAAPIYPLRPRGSGAAGPLEEASRAPLGSSATLDHTGTGSPARRWPGRWPAAVAGGPEVSAAGSSPDDSRGCAPSAGGPAGVAPGGGGPEAGSSAAAGSDGRALATSLASGARAAAPAGGSGGWGAGGEGGGGGAPGYTGHYVVLAGYDAARSAYLVRDPAAPAPLLRVPAEAVELARRSFGTDEDLLFVPKQRCDGPAPLDIINTILKRRLGDQDFRT